MNRPPLEIERLVSDHERRSPSTDAQAELPPPSYHDDIFDLSDRELDEMIEVDPYDGDPPSRRSDKELGRVLSILDSLEAERGNG